MSRRINEYIGLVAGILLIIGLNLVVVFLGLARLGSALGSPGYSTNINDKILFFGFYYIGIFQLLYVIPIVVISRLTRQFGFMKGVIIGALITLLLNGACYSIVSQLIR